MTRITLTGGPLNGRSFDIGATPAKLAVIGGHYTIDGDQSEWHPDTVTYTHVEPTVEDGQKVERGDQIGTIGEHAADTGCEKHRLVQHRDGKRRWCNACGLDADGTNQRDTEVSE